jgi:methyl-accepting chemotaxis protein
VTIARNLQGRQVLAAHARIDSLGWLVFVDLPLGEALAPMGDAILRAVIVLVLGLGVAVLASLALARRMVAPIRRLQDGAARVGQGELGHRIDVRTGDELEVLGEQFNRMAAQLQESYGAARAEGRGAHARAGRRERRARAGEPAQVAVSRRTCRTSCARR